jgi:hypothetical protein
MKLDSNYKSLALVVGIGIALVISFQLYTRVLMRPDTVGDIFSLVESQGYTPCVGFSGTFEPGNIIQVAERKSDDTEGLLEPPLVFMWAKDCFPGIQARDTTFVLPETSGTSSSALSVGIQAISRRIPSLNLNESAVVDYRLTFENVRMRTIPRGEISGKLSNECVSALNQEMATGDQIHWYRVIVEAIVADGISFEIKWKSGTKANVRNETVNKAMGNISKAVSSDNGSELDLHIEQSDSGKTILYARRPVIVGYRARPMQPKTENQ